MRQLQDDVTVYREWHMPYVCLCRSFSREFKTLKTKLNRMQ